MKLEEVLHCLDEIAPFSFALSWDNSGLQVGDPQSEIEKVHVALEPAASVLVEAEMRRAQLILTHHPLIFSPLKRLERRGYPGGILFSLVLSNMALVAMHTNWDVAPGGLSDALAQKLGLRVEGPLDPTGEGIGIGRIGTLPVTSLASLLTYLMESLPAPWARLVGDPSQEVEKVAVCPGSCGDLWRRAKEAGAQVLITGDVKHHQAREALEEGFSLVDLGHFATEAFGMRHLATKVKEALPTLEVSLDGSLRDPFVTYTKGG
jgi:dinuclear metal center YbgI/SA1388 family protein